MPATKQKMDFTNVKEGSVFRPKRKPEGDYLAKIVDVADHTSKEGSAGWVFTIKIDGDEKSTYPVYANADEKQAWKIRKMFAACGTQIPKKLVMVDPNKMVGKELGVSLEDDEYEGRVKSRVADFVPVEDIQPADDEDDEEELYEKPAKKTTTKKAAKKKPVIEDDDEDDEDDEPVPPKKKSKKAAAPVVEDDDEDEDDEEDEPPAKKPTKKAKKKPAPPVEDDEDEDDEDEEDEEPPAKKSKKSKGKSKPAKKKAPVDDDEDDEDDDLDLDDL